MGPYQQALREYEKALGLEHISSLATVNNLGLLYADQGKMEEAEEMYHWALKGVEKAWAGACVDSRHREQSWHSLPGSSENERSKGDASASIETVREGMGTGAHNDPRRRQ